jgi:hypothetical protein
MAATRIDPGPAEGAGRPLADLDAEPVPPPAWRWRLVVLWTAVAGLVSLVLWAQADVPLVWALVGALVEYYTLGVLAGPVWRGTSRITTAPWPTWRRAAAHVGLGLAVIALWRGVVFGFQYLGLGDSVWPVIYEGTWMFQGISAIAIYGVLLGAIMVLQSQARERDAERRTAALRVAAREAELGTLRAHLQPHFLFNSLTAVAALIDSDPARAQSVLLRLGDLLKSAYADLDEERVPLSRELALVRSYLDIEQLRFGDRLRVSVEADPDALASEVPPLILQPLVENAVKHGIAPHTRAGAIRVSAACAGGRLQVRIHDTGDGADPDAWPGHGLTITRRRLAAAYPSQHQLRFVREPGGFAVELDLPVEGAGVP